LLIRLSRHYQPLAAMAQCYTPWIRSRPCNEHPVEVHQPPPVTGASGRLHAEHLLESIYVFPNPPSAPPSTNASSPFSLPTDLTVSEFSDLKSGPISAHSSHPMPGDLDDEWEWTAAPAISTGTIDSDIHDAERVDRWEYIMRRRAVSGNSVASPSLAHQCPPPVSPARTIYLQRKRRSRTPSNTRQVAPHPRIHIPLLSAILSLLSVDDSTLYLLTHSASHSVLFPGHAFCSDAVEGNEHDGDIHGMGKLLASPSDTRSLKSGFAVACDPEFTPAHSLVFPSLPLVGLWKLASGVVANGGKALREVCRA
jgi:hypothetical protein